jgi:PAS domain S-box-containing protein
MSGIPTERERSVEVAGTPLDSTARIAGLEAALAMIAAKRDEFKNELALLYQALDAVPSYIMLNEHPAGTVRFVNDALCQIFGFDLKEIIGKQTLEVFKHTIISDVDQTLEALREKSEVRSEVRIRNAQGNYIWVGFTVRPIRDKAGNMTHTVVLGADITKRIEDEQKRKELQEQLVNEMRERERMAIELRLAQKLESVGMLAAGVAHEINTPIQYVGDSVYFLRSTMQDVESLLNAYKDALQAIAAGQKTTATATAELHAREESIDLPFLLLEAPKAFDRTLDGVDRVARIVRAMKEFSHPDTLEQSASDINHALETTLTVARSEYKYIASVKTQFNPIPEVICTIGELNQVFVNLIVNAAHAIESSGKDIASGEITISTAQENTWVLVTIADNGCGISPENLEHIFDPFFTTKEVGKGTGQGLAIAHSIVVDKHRGLIDVHSVVGEGTHFTLKLPIGGRDSVGALP